MGALGLETLTVEAVAVVVLSCAVLVVRQRRTRGLSDESDSPAPRAVRGPGLPLPTIAIARLGWFALGGLGMLIAYWLLEPFCLVLLLVGVLLIGLDKLRRAIWGRALAVTNREDKPEP